MSRIDIEQVEAYPERVTAWYSLSLFMLCYFMYFSDRNVLTLVVGPVSHDLRITSVQVGLLQGYAFSLLSAVMAFPFGLLADRWSRKGTLVTGLILWGGSTIASGLTVDFHQLLLTRVGLGVGEAALAPAALSLIFDYFPAVVRGRAVGVYGMGGFAGIGGSYLIGGAILRSLHGVDHVTLPVVGSTSVWQASFIVVGLLTMLLALTALVTLREPPRRHLRVAPRPVTTSFFTYLNRHRVSLSCVIIGYICCTILAIGWFAWLPTYFIRRFHMQASHVGLELGWLTLFSGIAGAIASGYLSDWLTRHKVKGGKLATLTIMFYLWIPCAVGILFSRTASLSFFCVAVFTFADGIGFAQYGNVVQEMFPDAMRGRSIAAFNVLVSALSYGLGPLFIGFAADHVFVGQAGLQASLGLIPMPIICLGLCVAWGGRNSYDRARAAADPAADADLLWLNPGTLTRVSAET